MYLYNVTVNLESTVAAEWLEWMKNKHTGDVIATGCFSGCRIMRLLDVEDQGSTYSVQYTFNKMEDYDKYQELFAPTLQKEHREKFEGKFVAFRTIMEEV